MSRHPLHGVKPLADKIRLGCDWGDFRGPDLWKCRFRAPGAKTWFVVKGTKPEVDAATATLQAEGKETVVSRL